MRSEYLPGPVGLYNPSNERDACGVGFVASIQGAASHDIVRKALQCVCNVTHRGAVSADAKTGDGAGILTGIPHALFAKALASMGAGALKEAEYAVGVFFLPKAGEGASKAREAIKREMDGHRLKILGWRSVPVDTSALGEKAMETLPDIQHVLIVRPEGISAQTFERQLFLVRRRIEQSWDKDALKDCYVPSMSCRTISYKGLLVAPQLSRFYRDLENPDYAAAIAVFHQRYSTNTFPDWVRAQPFRFLAHNGEINTLKGNVNWMKAREPELSSKAWGKDLRDLFPVIQADGSDSMNLDNVFEFLLMSGRDSLHAMMMLIPDAWHAMVEMTPEERAFYQYHSLLQEPWDGPAALAFTDGVVCGALLDRNGLRPARYWVTKDGVVIMGSEVGVVEIDPSTIVEKGRLGPGQILAVDTARKRLLNSRDIKQEHANAKPYAEWFARSIVPIAQLEAFGAADEVLVEADTLTRRQIAFGYNDEELAMVIEPMVKTHKEPILSMGNDTPLSVLSSKPQSLFTYFKQLFAQVTNPPIDPIREELVMSLNTVLGARPNLLEEGPAEKRMVLTESPLLLPQEFAAIRSLRYSDLKSRVLPMHFEVDRGPAGLRAAVKSLCKGAEKAVDAGATILILSDRSMDEKHAGISSLLAVGAVHHHLIRTGRRMKASLVVESGDVHDVQQLACLVGYGASCVYPYLAYQTIKAMERAGRFQETSFDQALKQYRRAMDQGLLKVMSKMGISTVGSYRGAQIFEAVGLAEELIDECFAGTPSRLGGVTYEHIGEDLLAWHRLAFHEQGPLHLNAGGFYKYRRDGEYHAFNPEMVRFLQQATKSGDYSIYKKFADVVNSRPPTAVRDLMDVKPIGPPVPIEEVESVEAVMQRFITASISYGALSIEAHETLAEAMNLIGGKSGSGEGGEAPERLRSAGTKHDKNSKVKQVASGRFGVTPEYLMSAEGIEIKMAQGSKPGEGGQLPGHKVSVEIARVRHTIPGVSLISPPPHHDIYSIEDLAQLIYDLKMINPKARICVKLVAEAGVGTIAAGVAKGYADNILISGHDGGTGASPLSSIKHAGLPWELGIAETQQTLRLNGLRKRIVLRADGGMKTGRDILMAALLGAEEYGFGTMPLIATGCVMTRKCHLNTCPVGVATQDPKLRARYTGKVSALVHYFNFVAQEVRELLAKMGARSIEEVIGRTELLCERDLPDRSAKVRTVDLRYLMTTVQCGSRFRTFERNDREGDEPIDDAILKDAAEAIEGRGKVKLSYPLRNINRTVGARVAGAIATRYGDEGLPNATVDITFRGVAGQSFGAFNINGMRLTLIGEANDYVGKSMAGGELIIRPPDESPFAWQDNSIIGNTCLYGATGGILYAAGRAGERFGVRNSGGIAVVEGLGDHGCEYMTGGIVLVLGPTGRNFGAGMTGGRAYVLDLEGKFEKRANLELIQLLKLDADEDINNIRALLERHFVATKSSYALDILTNWDDHQEQFWVVVPKGIGAKLDLVVSDKEG